MNETTARTRDDPPPAIFIIDPSKRCEPSAFLFSKAVQFFLVNGYRLAQHIDHSQIILINTCCVTEDKITVSRSALEIARAQGEGKRIVLFGCLAGLPVSDLEWGGVLCIGPQDLRKLDEHFPHHTPLDSITIHKPFSALYEPGQGLGHQDHFLLIAQGCSNHCTYCNIKRAKGEVRSEPTESIIRQHGVGLAMGVKEFVLLADDCASYGDDLGTDLVELMTRLLSVGPGFNLKLGYLYPQFLLTHLAGLKHIFATGRIGYANIPMQSGSQRILKLMNRRYDIPATMKAIGELRALAPQTTLCTHLIINFPTETHDDFRASLALADTFDEVIFLNYSDNHGTPAARLFPKVPEPEVRRRLALASEYVNRCKPGQSAVIADFNCDLPYNVRQP
jgi:MiaB/RimO family radical SAM methylthiotransferase